MTPTARAAEGHSAATPATPATIDAVGLQHAEEAELQWYDSRRQLLNLDAEHHMHSYQTSLGHQLAMEKVHLGGGASNSKEGQPCEWNANGCPSSAVSSAPRSDSS